MDSFLLDHINSAYLADSHETQIQITHQLRLNLEVILLVFTALSWTSMTSGPSQMYIVQGS